MRLVDMIHCFQVLLPVSLAPIHGVTGGRHAHRRVHGKVVQLEPTKPKLKPPGSKRLKLKCDVLLSNAAFKFNLRRYIAETDSFMLDMSPPAEGWGSMRVTLIPDGLLTVCQCSCIPPCPSFVPRRSRWTREGRGSVIKRNNLSNSLEPLNIIRIHCSTKAD